MKAALEGQGEDKCGRAVMARPHSPCMLWWCLNSTLCVTIWLMENVKSGLRKGRSKTRDWLRIYCKMADFYKHLEGRHDPSQKEFPLGPLQWWAHLKKEKRKNHWDRNNWNLKSEHSRNLVVRIILKMEVGIRTNSYRKCAHSPHESQATSLYNVAGLRSEPCGTMGPSMRPRKHDADSP